MEARVLLVGQEEEFALCPRRADDLRGRIGAVSQVEVKRPRVDGGQTRERRRYRGGHVIELHRTALGQGLTHASQGERLVRFFPTHRLSADSMRARCAATSPMVSRFAMVDSFTSKPIQRSS